MNECNGVGPWVFLLITFSLYERSHWSAWAMHCKKSLWFFRMLCFFSFLQLEDNSCVEVE
jgi:hypothetical protein